MELYLTQVNVLDIPKLERFQFHVAGHRVSWKSQKNNGIARADEENALDSSNLFSPANSASRQGQHISLRDKARRGTSSGKRYNTKHYGSAPLSP